MPYVPLDDAFHSHRKVIRLIDNYGQREGLEAIGLHMLGMSWAGGAYTDGHVPHSVDDRNGGKRAAKLREDLLNVGLRDDCDEHQRCSHIHDWGSINDPGDELKAAREKDRERKKEWRRKRRLSQDADGTSDGTQDRTRDGTHG